MFYLFPSILLISPWDWSSSFPFICKTTYRNECSQAWKYRFEDEFRNYYFSGSETFSSKLRRNDFVLFHLSWLICPIYFEKCCGKCWNGKRFFSIIVKFPVKMRAECKAGYIKGKLCNDSAIRLNKQRKVFNYSIEIFIKNFSHYFHCSFALIFFRCWESWQAKKTRKNNIILFELKTWLHRYKAITSAGNLHWYSRECWMWNLLAVAQSFPKSETIKAHKIIYQAH